jgi:hypothetical protein
LGDGDVVIQIPDINPHHVHGIRRLLWEYLWDATETGGQYEGQKVMSMVPGIGMLANGDGTILSNVLPALRPDFDDGGLSRQQHSPGTGATTHYHNFTWFVQGEMEEGDELFINYGEGWFTERGFRLSPPQNRKKLTVTELRKDGYCLDNLKPGPSTIRHACRGAFAARRLQRGSIVAPVPVIPLTSNSLLSVKHHESGRLVQSEQLLRNYCYGHSNSSLLLFPYSSMVNLINHPGDGQSPNVRLQWAQSSYQYFDTPFPVLQESSTRLLLELVALRDIEAGEELYMDYGKDWVDAWNSHLQNWEEEINEAVIIQSQQMNAHKNHYRLRTLSEQRFDPYPDNVFTGCFYSYSNRTSYAILQLEQQKAKVATDQWKHIKGIYETRNLRPCLVLDRHPTNTAADQKRQPDDILYKYNVRIMNYPGLPEKERIPPGIHYVVTDVPRNAIEFIDKIYTTDQHLPSAFRHHIGMIGEDEDDVIFPHQWMDLIE